MLAKRDRGLVVVALVALGVSGCDGGSPGEAPVETVDASDGSVDAPDATSGPARIATDKGTYARSESVHLVFSGLSGDSNAIVAIVAIVARGAGAGIHAAEVSLHGARDGAIDVALASVAPGAYVVRAYGASAADLEAESGAFAVTEADVPTLAVDRAQYSSDEAARVTFAGLSGDAREAIAIAADGAPGGTSVRSVSTGGARSGAVAIDLSGLASGAYVARVILGGAVRAQTAAFSVVRVVPPDAGDAGPDADVADVGDGAPPGPAVCGDGYRDPATEECDDGNDDDFDACSHTCRVRAIAAAPAPVVDGGSFARSLGAGAHPVAAGDSGFGVALSSPGPSFPALTFARLDARGARVGGPFSMGEGNNPVTAALPAGRFAVAFNDIGAAGDGDELGIALRLVDGTGVALGATAHANGTTAFNQFDPDIAFTGSEVVVAWTDTSNAITGRDIRVRRFTPALVALEDEVTLAATDAAESDVVLAPARDSAGRASWAAAWRRTDASGLESIEAMYGATAWSTAPFRPGPSDTKPALVQLDAKRFLVVYADGTSSATRLRAAVLDLAAPGTVAAVDIDSGATAATRPVLAKSADRIFLAWQTEAVPGDPDARETWLQQIGWDGAALDLSARRLPLPRQVGNRVGDQQTPALAATGDALFSAWVDLGRSISTTSRGDVIVLVQPTPILRLTDALP